MSHERDENGCYGPVIGKPIKNGQPLYRHYYKPQAYHNRTAASRNQKEKWIVGEGEQFSYFKIADENEVSPRWLCNSNSCLFSIGNNGRDVLGGKSERLAKFKIPQNELDPWHGYPVTTTDHEPWNTPSNELLDLWVKHNVINSTTRRRIERAKL